MNSKFNADIHCHPTTKPFMSGLIKKRDPIVSFDHDITSSLVKLLKKMLEKQSEVKLSSQSNFDHLFEGGHKIIVASITPMERAFLVANVGRKNNISFGNAFVFDNKVTLEDTIKPDLVNALMGFSVPCIEFVRDSTGLKDYFKDSLEPEYNYLLGFHNTTSKLHGYTLKLVNNFNEIENGIASGEKAIYVLLSIEGAHSLKSEVPTIAELKRDQERVHTNTELDNIENGKQVVDNIRKIKSWEFVPLYVTVMHHFWNGMGGHARSLNKAVGEMLNQQEGINQRLSETGKLAIKTLLETQFDEGSVAAGITRHMVPRILIDVKHMSVASRKNYYEMLDTVYHGQNIPIICSHTGIADIIDTFDELVQVNDKEEESNDNNYFHKAQINLCGEDIRRIVKSNGLIGIQLDEKRIAGAGFKKSKLNGGLNMNELMHECAKLIMANVFVAVRAVNTPEAWDVFCIGSDYDGLINHLDPFPTSAHSTILRDEIEFFLGNLVEINEPQSYNFKMSTDEMSVLMMGLSPAEITEKIFSVNVINFLSKNFRR